MTKQEFSRIAKKYGWNVYRVKKVREKGYVGIEITYSLQLAPNTVSTEKTRTWWNQPLEDILMDINE